jgi:UDP-glucose 4-epimerase
MILVTGAAGYIGSHFVRQFLSAHADEKVLAVDDLSSGHREALPSSDRVIFANESIGNREAMKQLMLAHKVDVVVHFAGSIQVGESEKNPLKYYENNVVNTIRMFEAMQDAAVSKLVFSSTCATYGTPEKLPLTEDHPQKPFSIYGHTKLMIEEILWSLNRTIGFSFIALRYFNASGADQSMEIGESHDPETHLIPNVLKTITGKQECLELYGTDYDTRDGTCIRDYIHVNDLSTAHVSAVDLLRKQNCAIGINLGTGYGATVKEITDLCKEISGKELKIKVFPRRDGDVPVLVADYSCAKEMLGWSPTYSLKEILESAWKWETNRRF